MILRILWHSHEWARPVIGGRIWSKSEESLRLGAFGLGGLIIIIIVARLTMQRTLRLAARQWEESKMIR